MSEKSKERITHENHGVEKTTIFYIFLGNMVKNISTGNTLPEFHSCVGGNEQMMMNNICYGQCSADPAVRTSVQT
jgi:hypothetical protein